MNTLQYTILANVNNKASFLDEIFSSDILAKCDYSSFCQEVMRWNFRIILTSESKSLLKTVFHTLDKYATKSAVEVYDMDANDIGINEAETKEKANDLFAEVCDVWYNGGDGWVLLRNMSFEKYNRLEKFF